MKQGSGANCPQLKYLVDACEMSLFTHTSKGQVDPALYTSTEAKARVLYAISKHGSDGSKYSISLPQMQHPVEL